MLGELHVSLSIVEPTRLSMAVERWPLNAPFQIAGYTFDAIEVLVVGLERSGHIGRGEASGVYYKGDTIAAMLPQIEAIRAVIEGGVDRLGLQGMLPPGGARNALDCALWDLDAKLSGRPVWDLAGLPPCKPLVTTMTCGAGAPADMAASARGYEGAKAIKLKLIGDLVDAHRVRAVRAARPDVWLAVDANQGCDRNALDQLMPVLVDCKVSLIEQPFPIGQEALLDGLQSPIPIAADESVQCLADIDALVGRFDLINIKLDKCGGLTEGLAMARRARQLGLDVMVGNMMGTSLAMAPAFVLGQVCDVVDLDGPLFLGADRDDPVQYSDGEIVSPKAIWGDKSTLRRTEVGSSDAAP
jgi:L-alanine-DL-glutamate epimerase-like enolase superfamily enzyme